MRNVTIIVTSAVSALAVTTSTWATPVEYTAGHADIRPTYENGELNLNYRFDANAVLDGAALAAPELYDPASAYVRVPDSTIADPADHSLLFSFFPDFFNDLGSPNEPFWTLPQNNVQGQPFFGFSTEELVGGNWGASFEFELTSFTGPGHFTLYQSGFGPNVFLSTASSETEFTFPAGHDHYNWAFVGAGLYELEFTVTTTHTSDGEKSASGTFLFAVGDSTVVPEPSSIALLVVASMAMIRRKR